MSSSERRLEAGRKLVIFELDQRLYRHLRRIADYRHETMADVLRKSVKDYIRRYGIIGEK